MNGIRCVICGTSYPLVDPELPRQGDGCCGFYDMNTRTIYFGYGSRAFDTGTIYLKEPLGIPDDSSVCDSCGKDLLRAHMGVLGQTISSEYDFMEQEELDRWNKI